MAEYKPGERLIRPLQVFRKRLETDVLGEKKSSEVRAPGEKGGIRKSRCIILMCCEHIHAQAAELIGNRGGNVNVEVNRCHAALWRRVARRRRRKDDAGCAVARSKSAISAAISASISGLWSK